MGPVVERGRGELGPVVALHDFAQLAALPSRRGPRPDDHAIGRRQAAVSIMGRATRAVWLG